MLNNLYLLGIRHRQAVILVILILTGILASGMPRLKVDTGLDSLIAANDPDRLVYRRVLEEFGADNKIYVYINDLNLWTPERLAALEDLQFVIENINGIDGVRSIFNLRTLQRRDNGIEAGTVIETLPQTTEEALALQEILLQSPAVSREFLSPDGRATTLIVSLASEGMVQAEGERIYNAIEEALAARRDTFEVLFQVGEPRVYTELKEQLASDFLLLVPASAIIVLLSILLFVRSFMAALIPLLTAAIALVWTFGMQAWVGIPITILSTMLPSLVIIIAATTNMHIIIAYLRCMRPGGRANHEAIMSIVANHAGLSFLLTTVVVMLGFASNSFNNIDLIRGFALSSTFAILANGLVTIFLVPMLLQVYQRASERFMENRNLPDKYPGRLLVLFRQSQSRFPRVILGITALLCIFFYYHASTFYVTNDPVSYFSENQSLLQDNQRLHRELAGANTFFITLESNSSKAFLEPRNIEKLAQIQDFVAEQGIFDQSRSLANLLQYVHRQVQGEQPGLGLPRTRQLVAQYLLLFHRSELEQYVSQDYSRANIIVRHNINDSRLLNQHIRELESVVAQTAGAELVSSVVGKNLMVNQAAESLKQAQIKAFLILLGLIFIIVSILFTSAKGGIIALVPAIIPVGIMFGVMGLLGIPLNPGSAMVAVIAVGLAVDGTIQLLTRYIELCRKSSDYLGAVTTTVNEVAPALIISSLALALGFAVLIFSNFTVVAQFGALVTATLLLSIFANLMITPILMSRIRLVGLYQILAMSVDDKMLGTCTLFRDMTEYQRRKAILISELHKFDGGELLIEQDTSGRSMYLILTGEAEVVRRDGDNAHVLASLGPGQIFGEIGYIRETRRTADVKAKTEVTALKFDYERLQKDLKYFPNIVAKLNCNISYILGKRLADMVEQTK